MTRALSGATWRRTVRDQWSAAARGWERWEAHLLYYLSSVDPVLLRALELRPGQRVLDFGCGTGEPALTIARWVAPRGEVIGLDVAGPMLEIARRRARHLGVRNARFRRGDITRSRLSGPRFDRVSSRFGLMFADDVLLALRRVRGSLKPRGRAAFAVWGPFARNPSIAMINAVMQPFMEGPPPDPEVSPHPMRLARTGLLARMMRRAGFRGVKSEGVILQSVYPDADAYVSTMLGIAGPFVVIYRGLTKSDQRRVRERLRRGAARFASGGAVRIPAFAWVVSGRR